jgi:hypothetical protein
LTKPEPKPDPRPKHKKADKNGSRGSNGGSPYNWPSRPNFKDGEESPPIGSAKYYRLGNRIKGKKSPTDLLFDDMYTVRCPDSIDEAAKLMGMSYKALIYYRFGLNDYDIMTTFRKNENLCGGSFNDITKKATSDYISISSGKRKWFVPQDAVSYVLNHLYFCSGGIAKEYFQLLKDNQQ